MKKYLFYSLSTKEKHCGGLPEHVYPSVQVTEGDKLAEFPVHAIWDLEVISSNVKLLKEEGMGWQDWRKSPAKRIQKVISMRNI